MTAEDFIELNVQKTKFDTPSGIAIVTQNDAINCCEEYAKQQAIAFDEWKRKENYYWHAMKECHIASWNNYSEHTTEQLYNLFIQNLQQ